MYRKVLIRIPVFLLSVSLTAVIMFSTIALAGNTGSISGLVIFEDGEELAGVLVVIKGGCMFSTTDADGYYVIMGVPPGKYEVKAARVGYGEITSGYISVTADKRTRLDFTFYFWHPRYTIDRFGYIFNDGVEVFKAEDIEKRPADDLAGIILRVPGVVDTGGE